MPATGGLMLRFWVVAVNPAGPDQVQLTLFIPISSNIKAVSGQTKLLLAILQSTMMTAISAGS